MLKGIDPRMTADLIGTLMQMGHGDEIVVADRNFPAHSTAAATVTGRLIELPSLSTPEAIGLICSVMPLDGFVPAGAMWMQVDGQGDRPDPVHDEALAVIAAILPDGGGTASIERQDFYVHAKTTYAVVRCTEDRPYGCFILRKGVIF